MNCAIQEKTIEDIVLSAARMALPKCDFDAYRCSGFERNNAPKEWLNAIALELASQIKDEQAMRRERDRTIEDLSLRLHNARAHALNLVGSIRGEHNEEQG